MLLEQITSFIINCVYNNDGIIYLDYYANKVIEHHLQSLNAIRRLFLIFCPREMVNVFKKESCKLESYFFKSFFIGYIRTDGETINATS